MEGDEGFEAADASAANEDSGGGVLGREAVLGRRRREGSDLAVFEFDDGGVDTDGGQEFLHDVTHAAG